MCFIFIVLVVYVVGLALFQANAIQFGLDQLLEAPTSKLMEDTAFIHWYYWAQNVSSLALFYVTAGSGFIQEEVNVFTNGTIKRIWHGNFAKAEFVLFFIAMSVVITCITYQILHHKEAFLCSESWTQSIQEYLQSTEVLKIPPAQGQS